MYIYNEGKGIFQGTEKYTFYTKLRANIYFVFKQIQL